MITVDPSRLGSDELWQLSTAWFALCRRSPRFDPAGPLGEFLWQLACACRDEIDERDVTLNAMEIELGDIGAIIPEPPEDDVC